jgi:MFS family permease
VRQTPVTPGPCRGTRAPALGPAVGGLLISAFGWRSVFLVNVPVGLLALAGVRAARRTLPAGGEPGHPDRSARLDVPA